MNSFIKYIPIVIITSLLFGCGGGKNATEGLDGANADSEIKIISLAVNYIGDGKELFNSKKNQNGTAARGTTMAKVNVTQDLSDPNSATMMKSGTFYDVSIAFNVNDDHPDGIPFDIHLVKIDPIK